MALVSLYLNVWFSVGRLRRIRKCGLVRGVASFGVDFEALKVSARSSVPLTLPQVYV